MNNSILLQTIGYSVLLIFAYEFLMKGVKQNLFKTILGGVLYTYPVFITLMSTFKYDTSWYMIMFYVIVSSLVCSIVTTTKNIGKLKDYNEDTVEKDNRQLLVENESDENKELLEENGVKFDGKTVEITEGYFIGNVGTAVEKLEGGQILGRISTDEDDDMDIIVYSDDDIDINDKFFVKSIRGNKIIAKKIKD